MINVGLIGFGLAGRVLHAPLIEAAGMRITSVVTSRHGELAGAIPAAQPASSAEQLLARNDIDMVVIVTPNHLHVPQARAALAAGKHVVVDKPLCLEASQADELIALATRQRRRLAIFQNRRWDSDFLTIHRLVREQRLGEVMAFHARWDRYRPAVADRWREHDVPGAGMLFDLGSHLIDQALCLFGRPEWLQADVFSQRPAAQVADGFELWMGKGALRISLGVSSLAADNRLRYRLFGNRASYTKSGIDPQEAQLRAGLKPLSTGFGTEPPDDHGALIHGDGRREIVASDTGRWLTFYERMRDAVSDERIAVPVTAGEAKSVIELIEAAVRSSERGRRIDL